MTNSDRAARDLLILQLFNRGENPTIIATMVGMSDAKAVIKALQRIMAEHIMPELEVARAVEAERIRSLMKVIQPYLDRNYLAEEGTEDFKVIQARAKEQLTAVGLGLKAGERYSKLCGLDMPTKQEVSGPDGAVPFVVQMNWPAPSAENTEVVQQEEV